MITREEAKMFFDSDLEVLEKAFDSDKDIIESTQTIISHFIAGIFDVFVQKGILKEDEAINYLNSLIQEMNKKAQERNKKIEEINKEIEKYEKRN